MLHVKAQSFPELEKNEVKLNALYLAEGTFEVSYERQIGRVLGLGLSSYITFREYGMQLFGDSYPWNFSITPFLRVYFGKSGFKGFFLEGNVMLGSNTQISNDLVNGTNTGWDLGVGFGYGAKWVFDKNWGFEVYAGMGLITTNLYDTPPEPEGLFDFGFDWPEVYPRCGISVVKRF